MDLSENKVLCRLTICWPLSSLIILPRRIAMGFMIQCQRKGDHRQLQHCCTYVPTLHQYIQIIGRYAPSASYHTHTQSHKRLIKHLDISLHVVVPPSALYVRQTNPTFHENIGVVWPIFD
jgi:hypothetical protein